jgi:hypothetical protein
LKPDNGDTTIAASNTAALKDARTKIQSAQKDLKAAQKDIKDIINIIIKDVRSWGNMGTSSPKQH